MAGVVGCTGGVAKERRPLIFCFEGRHDATQNDVCATAAPLLCSSCESFSDNPHHRRGSLAPNQTLLPAALRPSLQAASVLHRGMDVVRDGRKDRW